MGKVGHFLHSPSSTTVVTGIGTSYDITKAVAIKAARNDINNQPIEFKGYIESLLFAVSNIAGGASKFTVRICIDANGDLSAIGDVEVPIDLGITTATSGTCQILYDRFPFDNILGVDTLYIFFKVNAGSANVTTTQLNWSE